jgi:hypothetical protein
LWQCFEERSSSQGGEKIFLQGIFSSDGKNRVSLDPCYVLLQNLRLPFYFSVFLLFSVFSFPRNSAYCMVFFSSLENIGAGKEEKCLME